LRHRKEQQVPVAEQVQGDAVVTTMIMIADTEIMMGVVKIVAAVEVVAVAVVAEDVAAKRIGGLRKQLSFCICRGKRGGGR
jgi:hypothetical protein